MRDAQTPPPEDSPVRSDNIERLLDSIARLAGREGVSLRAVVEALGPRSFGPLLLLPALAIVSPISALPGVPSMLALIIGLIAAQVVIGRRSIWLPAVLLEARLSDRRLLRAVAALRPVVRVVDPWINERLTALTDRPGNLVALAICSAAPMLMPVFELVPFLSSLTAAAIALFAVGLSFRDGLMMLAGYALVAGGLALALEAAEEIRRALT